VWDISIFDEFRLPEVSKHFPVWWQQTGSRKWLVDWSPYVQPPKSTGIPSDSHNPSSKHVRHMWWPQQEPSQKLLQVSCRRCGKCSKSTARTTNKGDKSIKHVRLTGNRSGIQFKVCCRQRQRWLKLAGPVKTVRIHRKTTSMTEYRYATQLKTLKSASFDNVRLGSRCKLF